jgi:hypothetical protein
MATKNEVLRIMAFLAAAYPDQGQRIDPKVLEMQNAVYVDLLADLAPEDLLAGAKEHIRLSEWFPKISELRRQAEKIRARKYYSTFEAQNLLEGGEDRLELGEDEEAER